MEPYATSLADVMEAQRRVAPYVHATPVLTCTTLSRLASVAAGRRVELFFKCENLQRSGSFKLRGAANAVFSLPDEDAPRGVVTHSSGNHAAALALAASLRGIPAYIVVPSNTPQVKLDAILSYNGRITQCAPTLAAREAAAAKVQAATGATLVPPFNCAEVIAGQGTIAVELLYQVPALDAIVVPVSGGGMLGGIAVAAKALKSGIAVVAAEPSGDNDAADVAASLAQRRRVTELPPPLTLADGLRAHMGDLTWPIVRDHVDAAVAVSEDEILAAMALVYERMKLVVEPSGAVGLAAVLSPRFAAALPPPLAAEEAGAAPPLRVGVVLCGGNADLGGLWAALRSARAAAAAAASK